MLLYSSIPNARVVELADSLDSGSSVHSGRAGSSPASRTKFKRSRSPCGSGIFFIYQWFAGFLPYFSIVCGISGISFFAVGLHENMLCQRFLQAKCQLNLPLFAPLYIVSISKGTRLTAPPSGAFSLFHLGGRQSARVSKSKNHSKIRCCQVQSSFCRSGNRIRQA